MDNPAKTIIYGLKDIGLAWFLKIKKGLEARIYLQPQVDTCVCYREEMVQLFYMYHSPFFSISKNKTDDV